MNESLLKFVLIFPIVITLTACGGTKIVKVPVPVPCPEPPVIEQPELPISSLNRDSKYDEVAKAYAESIIILREHTDKLEQILEGYRKNGSSSSE